MGVGQEDWCWWWWALWFDKWFNGGEAAIALELEAKLALVDS